MFMLLDLYCSMYEIVGKDTPARLFFLSFPFFIGFFGLIYPYHWFGAVLQISVGGSFEDVVDLGGADD